MMYKAKNQLETAYSQNVSKNNARQAAGQSSQALDDDSSEEFKPVSSKNHAKNNGISG